MKSKMKFLIFAAVFAWFAKDGQAQNPGVCGAITNSPSSGQVLSAAATGSSQRCTWVNNGGGGGGGVLSVGLTMPGQFSVGGSPVTSTGSFTVAWANQSANLIFAGPSSGAAAAPAFRSMVLGDMPTIGTNTVLGNVTAGTAIPTALSTIQLTALVNVFSATLSGAVPASSGGTTNFLRADGSWATPGGGGVVTHRIPMGLAINDNGGFRGIINNGSGTTTLNTASSGTTDKIGIVSFVSSTQIWWPYVIPSTWDGNAPTINLMVLTSTNLTGNFSFIPSSAPAAPGADFETLSYTPGTTVTTAAPGGSGSGFYLKKVTLTVPITGLVAGNMVIIRIARGSSDTYAGTIYGVEGEFLINY